MSRVVDTGTVLDRIVTQTRRDLATRMQQVRRTELQRRFELVPEPVDVAQALNGSTVSVIAEVKRASPSKGRFPAEVDPPSLAAAYAAGGATAISCLTDGPFFQGSLDDLVDVTEVTSRLSPPIGVLRKDFTVDPYQIDEARAAGASAILLIVACLEDAELEALHAYARSLGLAVIVEVHDEPELARAVAIEPRIVGINNRNLKTLAVDLSVTLTLAPKVPADVVVVGESGIINRSHVDEIGDVGVDAILVGESLIVQPDRERAVRALTGVEKRTRA